jgi:drug/metabolite transporter (DMT)-like permease
LLVHKRPWPDYAAFPHTAATPMALAYLAWFRALRLLPASTALKSVLVSPLVGVLASATRWVRSNWCGSR